MGETGSRSWALARSTRKRLFGNRDLRIVLQLFKAAVCNNVPGVDAFDSSLPGVRDTWLDVAYLSRAVLDEVDERGLAVMLNGGSGNQRDPLQSVHQQPGVYELVGEQSVVFVIEERPQLHRTCSGIDLVVESQELSGRDLRQLRPIKGIDLKPLAMARLRQHLGKAVFGNGKDDGDRLHFGDHDQDRRSARLDNVPRIHQP